MSSSDAILFMLATSLSRDLYHRFLHPSANDGDVLRVARRAAVVGGLLGTGLAIVSESIVDTLAIFYTLLTVSLFVPIIAGLYTRSVGPTEVLAAIGAGIGFVLVVQIGSGGTEIAGLTPAMIGLAAAVLTCTSGAAIRQRHL